MVSNKLFSKLKIRENVLISCVNRTETVHGTLRLFPVFISPIVYCVNIFIMNRYISKTATQRARILLPTIYRVGAAVVSTISSVTVRLVRCASRIIRSARFRIRRTLSSTSLLHEVHTVLAYLIRGLLVR